MSATESKPRTDVFFMGVGLVLGTIMGVEGNLVVSYLMRWLDDMTLANGIETLGSTVVFGILLAIMYYKIIKPNVPPH